MKIALALIIGYWIRSLKGNSRLWLYVGNDHTKYDEAVIGILTKGK